jgi:hypothetical protein
MSYTVTIYSHTREKVKQKTFAFRSQAVSWLLVSGFIHDELVNPLTGEYAELKRTKT